MKTAEIINQVCSNLGISKSNIAKKMGLYPSSFYRKISNETMSLEELQECLANIGVEIEFDIIYPSGATENSRTSDNRMRERIKLLKQELETANTVNEFHKSALKDLRTELNNATGYVELLRRKVSESAEFADKLQSVHSSMEKTIAYSLGESYAEDDDNIDLSRTVELKGLRVLLVEDNELNREILKEILEDKGLNVDEACNGKEAIAAMLDNPPGHYHFILMDIEMPEQNGYEATSVIRALPNRLRANTPIIALTANADEEDREKAFASGMDDFLVKPVNTPRLLKCLSRYL